MSKFIRLTVVAEYDDATINEPTLIAIDAIEQIRLTREGTVIYWKHSRETKTGKTWMDTVVETAAEIGNILDQDKLVVRLPDKVKSNSV